MSRNTAAPRQLPDLIIEDLEFMYRPNFSGNAERYNKEGNRYFNAKIDPTIAEALSNDGWNVKWTKLGEKHPNPDEFVSEPFVVVTVGFTFRPPKIVLIRDGRETAVTERTVAMLDSIEFSNIDVAIRGVLWQDDQGNSGYKAWLKSFFGTVEMDALDRKYAYLSKDDSSDDIDDLQSADN